MISILIPVYNTRQDFLEECLKSCLEQSIDSYEIVIVNNGSDSTDTLSTLKKYSLENKISIYKCERIAGKKNLSVALNFGLEKCRFDLVARMDSDDIMTYDRLEKQMNFLLENEDVDILGGQIRILPSGRLTNHKQVITAADALTSSWFINHPSVMYRKSSIMSIGGYLETPEMFAEDYELWLRSIGEGLQIRNLKDCVLNYRMHGDNLTNQTMKNPEYNSLMQKHRDDLRRKMSGNF